MHDLLPKNIIGYWKDLAHKDIFWIKSLETLDLDKFFLALSLSQNQKSFDELDLLPHDLPIIMSFHMEYFWHKDLLKWFDSRSTQRFLLISDWNTQENFWPENVTAVRWITWHHQLDTVIRNHGICDTINPPIKKFSSLVHMHEYHKAAVTAFLLSKFSRSEIEISWWNKQTPSRLDYLQEGYCIHPRIYEYLSSDQFLNLQPIYSSGIPGTPVENSNWRHPAYSDCAINLTNESVFNYHTQIDDKIFNLPGPYLTEKTWKPMLAGRAFIPVGQPNTVQCLEELGMEFQWLKKMKFNDPFEEDNRLLAIMDLIEKCQSLSCYDLWMMTFEDARKNLDLIKSGEFKNRCDQFNEHSFNKISQWVVDSVTRT